jgi:hypothetical protein
MKRTSLVLATKIVSAAVLAFALIASAHANVGDPPPGSIFDLSQNYNGVLSNYQHFTTGFTATSNATYVSFAFREVPHFFAFDDVSVTEDNSNVNLIQAGDFEGLPFNQQGIPAPWHGWNQGGISFAGYVANGASACAPNAGGPVSGGNYWCDGSVEEYDALFQLLTTQTGHHYNISFYLGDNSGQHISNPEIDMLVYAGDHLPDGTQEYTPEPGTLALFGSAAAGIGGILRRELLG